MVKKVFVFGSNKAGVHGRGAALDALRYYGAIYGLGYGAQGNSYAIPTKDENLVRLKLDEIASYIDGFLRFARSHGHQEFYITRIGCGLAGYNWEKDIRRLFPEQLPRNCKFITSDVELRAYYDELEEEAIR